MEIRALIADNTYELVYHNCKSQTPIIAAYTSDLLSDVLANATDDSILITIQAHRNCVAVASITGITAILICSNKTISDDMIEAAKEAEVTLLRTALNQFEASVAIGKLLESNPA